jgi:hypothetical protein
MRARDKDDIKCHLHYDANERTEANLFVSSHHRIGRVLSFPSPVVGIGTSPTPHPQVSVPPLEPGGGHTRLREKGWESPNSDEGIYTVVLYIYKHFTSLDTVISYIKVPRTQLHLSTAPPPLI